MTTKHETAPAPEDAQLDSGGIHDHPMIVDDDDDDDAKKLKKKKADDDDEDEDEEDDDEENLSAPKKKKTEGEDGALSADLKAVGPSGQSYLTATFSPTAGKLTATLVSEGPIPQRTSEGEPYMLHVFMSGARLPKSVPLTTKHQPDNARDIVGLVDNLRVENHAVVGDIHVDPSEAAILSKLTAKPPVIENVSAGFTHTMKWVPVGKTTTYQGTKYHGPALLAERFFPFELALVQEGADKNAKISISQLNRNVIDDSPLGGLLDKPNETPVENKVVETIDTDKIKAEAIAEHKAFCAAVKHECKAVNLESEADSLVEKCANISEVQKALLKKIADDQKKAPVSVNVGASGEELQYNAQRDALLARCLDSITWNKPEAIEKLRPKTVDQRFYNFRCVDHAKAMLKARNVNCEYMSDEEVARTALLNSNDGYGTQGSLPGLMADVAHKVAAGGYQDAIVTYDMCFAQMPSTRDLKDVNIINDSQLGYLDAWAEGTEPLEKKISDSRNRVKITSFSNLISFTWHAVVNDDLNRLAETPAKAGRAARRTINRECWGEITGNPVMDEDSLALFDSSHNNSTGNAAPSSSQASSMTQLMMQQTDLDGKSLIGLNPRFIVGPPALDLSVRQLTGSQYDPTANKFLVLNPFATGYTPIIEPELHNSSDVVWYILPDRSDSPVKYVFLQGQESPRVDTYIDPKTRALMINILQTFGVKVWDHRRIVKNPGQ